MITAEVAARYPLVDMAQRLKMGRIEGYSDLETIGFSIRPTTVCQPEIYRDSLDLTVLAVVPQACQLRRGDTVAVGLAHLYLFLNQNDPALTLDIKVEENGLDVNVFDGQLQYARLGFYRNGVHVFYELTKDNQQISVRPITADEFFPIDITTGEPEAIDKYAHKVGINLRYGKSVHYYAITINSAKCQTCRLTARCHPRNNLDYTRNDGQLPLVQLSADTRN